MINLFKQEPLRWITPEALAVPEFVQDLAKQPHVLIGGATGSGKSVLLHALIYHLITQSPNRARLLLLDPKACELSEFATLPHTWRHCDSVSACVNALNEAAKLMDQRFREMKKERVKISTRPPVYILIDEWIDLKTQAGKLAELPAIRIIAKGRAAGIHLILCTQRPTRDIINGAIKANFSAKVALRCDNRQESRNLLDQAGAELLPIYGQCLYKSPASKEPIKYDVPMIQPEEVARILEHWKKQTKRKPLII